MDQNEHQTKGLVNVV